MASESESRRLAGGTASWKLGTHLIAYLVVAALALVLSAPLGLGPVPLPFDAYSVSLGSGPMVSPANRATTRASTFVVENDANEKEKLTFLFHKPVQLKMELRDPPSEKGHERRIQVRVNGRRDADPNFSESGVAVVEKDVLRGDRIGLVLLSVSENGGRKIHLAVELYCPVSRCAYSIVAMLWAVMMLMLRYSGRALSSAIFLVMTSLVGFAERLSSGPLGLSDVMAYSVVIFGVMFVIPILCDRFPARRFLETVTTTGSVFALSALHVVYLGYFQSFGCSLDDDILNTILQTNFAEALEFVQHEFGLVYVVALVAMFGVVAFLSYIQARARDAILHSMVALVLGALLLVVAVPQALDLPVPRHFREGLRVYRSEVASFGNALAARKEGRLDLDAAVSSRAEVHVVVIGESQNKKSMGLYGYARATTPRLSQRALRDELVVVRNGYSSHTHTMETLTLALTSANQLNGEDVISSPSLLDIARAAGIATCWISNQAMYGPWDNKVSAISSQANEIHRLNRSFGKSTTTSRFDEEVLPYLREFIERDPEVTKLVVIHLMGNHGNYCDRYPKRFAVFDGAISSFLMGRLAGRFDDVLNCYDNSMVYNDFVVDHIIDELRRGGGVASMSYFADHGEAVFDGLRHASSRFVYGMTEIPVFFWLSDPFRQNYQQRSDNLSANREALFPNDFIYDTIVGLMGITTRHYNEQCDLSSSSYFLDERSARTLNGKRKFVTQENVAYQQQRNLKNLAANGLATRVIPHRVNTLGKLFEVRWDGAEGVEVDVKPTEDGMAIEVGHGTGTQSGGSLQEFLEAAPAREMRKIWIDVKELSTATDDALQRLLLNYDERYGLRERVIVETSAVDVDLRLLDERGFHTSYYLPSGAINDAIAAGDSVRLTEIAARIAGRVKDRNFDAVSFDVRLFPFVSDYLQARLDPSVRFNVWDLSMKLSSESFMADLQSKDYFKEDRVETILVPYVSAFTL